MKKNEQVKKTQEKIDKIKPILDKLEQEMSKVIFGQKVLINRLLTAIICQGHILVEGVPGLAKTTAISTLAHILNIKFQRIQFTPDLLPSDLVGSRVFDVKDSSFFIKKGPVFANFILADEINRSPAKVQSALLEAMQEKQVTIGEQTFKLDEPFFVMATQNPVEQEGTYPLPEAQVDRFLMKTIIDYPTQEEEIRIIEQSELIEKPQLSHVMNSSDLNIIQNIVNTIYIDQSIKEYICNIVFASRYPEKHCLQNLKRMIAYGASPRASIGLMTTAKAQALLKGRAYVIPEDVKDVSLDVLRHRLIPSYEAEAEGVKVDELVKKVVDSVRVP